MQKRKPKKAKTTRKLQVSLKVLVTTKAALVAAFTEWDRRFREEPERFQAEAVRLLKGNPESYGEAAAPYLLSILKEQRRS